MTREDAIKNQAELAKHFNLGYWYGTGCKKCCDVYPKFHSSDGFDSYCWFECEVCGTRTEKAIMPWIAQEEWNAGKFSDKQLSQFSLF